MTPTLRETTAWRRETGRTKGPLTLRDHIRIEKRVSELRHREWEQSVWVKAHEAAAHIRPRIISGLCQLPGLAAELANFALEAAKTQPPKNI